MRRFNFQNFQKLVQSEINWETFEQDNHQVLLKDWICTD